MNTMKSNYVTHVLLNSASLRNSDTDHSVPISDIILIQEPWIGKIGLDVKSGADVLGPNSHPDWTAILPFCPPDTKPDVLAYVRKSHPGWRLSNRMDIAARPDTLTLEISYDGGSVLLTNLYNPSDNSAAPALPLTHLSQQSARSVIIGDFNLHHPEWSHEGRVSSSGSEDLVDRMIHHGYSLLNTKGVATFFRKSYTSVLDLGWASSAALPLVSDWNVMHNWHQGSDHYPISLNLSFSPLPNDSDPSTSPFSFHDNHKESWCKTFSRKLHETWIWDDVIEREDDFDATTCSLSDALVDASKEHSRRKPRKAKAAKWFNQDVRKAVKIVRKDRKRDRIFHSPHNSLRYHASLNQLKYEVKKAKRSHAMTFAANITPSKVWSLNSWYRGARKSLTPALQRSDDSWASSSAEKAEVLLDSWFPPPRPPP